MLWLTVRRPRRWNVAAILILMLAGGGGLYLGGGGGAVPHRQEGGGEPANFIRAVRTEQHVVALTFDDGPHPTVTPQVLDILRDQGVKATFFLLGEHCERYPALVQRIAAEGHEIGNHGYTHKFLGKMPPAVSAEDAIRTNAIIFELTGRQTTLFRPPGGSYNGTLLSCLQEHGLTAILWSIDPRDWANPGPRQIRQRVLAQLRPGAIIIMHDNRDPSDTVKALPGLLADLTARGYRVVTVGELLAIQRQQLARAGR